MVLLGVAATAALAGPSRLLARGAAGWLALLGLAVTGVISLAASLRPLHLPAWSGSSRRLLAAGVGLAALASVLLGGDGAMGEIGDGRCLGIGLVVSGPLFALGLLSDRRPLRAGLFRAAAAAIGGALAVQLFCPTGGLLHLLVQHFAVVPLATAAFVVVGLGLARAQRRRQSPDGIGGPGGPRYR